MRNHEVPPKLCLDERLHGVTPFGGNQTTLEAVLLDMLDIYDPPETRFDRIISPIREQYGVPYLELTPPPRPNPDQRIVPNYRLSVSKVPGKMNAGDLVLARVSQFDLPGRAAGWAALQFYQHITQRHPLLTLQLIDPREMRKYQAETHDWQLSGVSIEQAANSSSGQAYNTEISFTSEPIKGGYPGDSRTVLCVKNYACLPLPGLLGVVRDVYDELCPHQSEAISAAVANMVGAYSVDRFQKAWDEAVAAAAGVPPARAVRTLLESDAFLRDQV